MIRGKGDMVQRMPILGGDDGVKYRLNLIDDRHDRVARRNGERSSGAKIVLNIHDQKCFFFFSMVFPSMEAVSF